MDSNFISFYLLVVAGVESTVGDSEKSARLGVVSILTVALEERQRRNKVTLLQEVASIRQLHLLLLIVRGE